VENSLLTCRGVKLAMETLQGPFDDWQELLVIMVIFAAFASLLLVAVAGKAWARTRPAISRWEDAALVAYRCGRRLAVCTVLAMKLLVRGMGELADRSFSAVRQFW
jgi:hypothetical protein